MVSLCVSLTVYLQWVCWSMWWIGTRQLCYTGMWRSLLSTPSIVFLCLPVLKKISGRHWNFSLGEIGKKFKVEYLRNANPQYDALARDCSPRRPLPGDDVILPRPLPVCMQMRSKCKNLRSNISGTERDRRKILSPHDRSPQPLQIPPYHLYLRVRVWGSEPQNPKFTFFDRNFFFVSRILSYLLNR